MASRCQEKDMHTCQVCGKDNPAGVEYCEDCGAVLTGAGPGASQGSATSIPVSSPAAQDGGTSIPLSRTPSPAASGAGTAPPAPGGGTEESAPTGSSASAPGATAGLSATNGA